MDEALVGDDYLSLEVRSLLPGAKFFVLDSVLEEAESGEYAERIGGRSHVMLADGDADGLAAVVLALEAFEDFGYVTTSPNDLVDALDEFVEHLDDGATVYIVDLCLDGLEEASAAVELLAEKADVYWYDHHQWDPDTVEALEALGIEVVIGDSDEVCSADVALQEFRGMGIEFPEELEELVRVTRDHDLWIKEDARSDDLADLSVYLDGDEYVEAVRNGVDVGEEYRDYLEEKRREKQRLVDLAVGRAEFTSVGGVEVAHTYGRCSQNEVSEELRLDGADAVVVAKPEGGMSIRGSEGFERCHEVAGLLGGGGHPRAAGCKPPVFDDIMDFAEHWVYRGERARMKALEAFREVLDGE